MKKLNAAAAAIMSVLGTRPRPRINHGDGGLHPQQPLLRHHEGGASQGQRSLATGWWCWTPKTTGQELANVEDLAVRKVNAILINPTDWPAVGSAIRPGHQGRNIRC